MLNMIEYPGIHRFSPFFLHSCGELKVISKAVCFIEFCTCLWTSLPLPSTSIKTCLIIAYFLLFKVKISFTVQRKFSNKIVNFSSGHQLLDHWYAATFPILYWLLVTWPEVTGEQHCIGSVHQQFWSTHKTLQLEHIQYGIQAHTACTRPFISLYVYFLFEMSHHHSCLGGLEKHFPIIWSLILHMQLHVLPELLLPSVIFTSYMLMYLSLS